MRKSELQAGMLVYSTKSETGYEKDTIFEVARGTNGDIIECCMGCTSVLVWGPRLDSTGHLRKVSINTRVIEEDKWKAQQHYPMWISVRTCSVAKGSW